jgi:hypothetical protein
MIDNPVAPTISIKVLDENGTTVPVNGTIQNISITICPFENVDHTSLGIYAVLW